MLTAPAPGAVWIAAAHATATNARLASAFETLGLPAFVVDPAVVDGVASAGDLVLNRIDVRPTLDGVDPGGCELRWVEGRGVRVLNSESALHACHDKLRTALRLGRLGVPHPATLHLDYGAPLPDVACPVVVKPRYGSWGEDVFLCSSSSALRLCLESLEERSWLRRQGVLLQTLVPSHGYDLRLIVAAGRVVGAIERVAAAGEWRTNVALGGTRRAVDPPPAACLLAVAAAEAVGADLVGVDLLPLGDGGYVVLELNGAVDFTSDYSIGGREVFAAVAEALAATALVNGESIRRR